MHSTDFLFAVLAVGLVFFGFGLIIGRYRRDQLDGAERFSLRLSLEWSLLAIAFALLPFPLFFVSGAERAVWGLASLLLGLVLLTQVIRIAAKLNVFAVRWPLALGLLLVLSAVFSTIELLNALFVRGLAWYAWGLLWLLMMAGLQVVAFLFYDRTTAYETLPLDIPPAYEHHNLVADRVRRDRRASRTYGATVRYRHANFDPITHARLERYADRYGVPRARDGNWRPFPNPVVRPDAPTGPG